MPRGRKPWFHKQGAAWPLDDDVASCQRSYSATMEMNRSAQNENQAEKQDSVHVVGPSRILLANVKRDAWFLCRGPRTRVIWGMASRGERGHLKRMVDADTKRRAEENKREPLWSIPRPEPTPASVPVVPRQEVPEGYVPRSRRPTEGKRQAELPLRPALPTGTCLQVD